MTLLTTSIPGGKLVSRGKVRDIYAVDDGLLLVATDRISAFDCVLSPGIPGRGVILTQLSNFWFDRFADVPNHLLATERARFPRPYCDHAELDRRSVLVRRLEPFPVECVARGYLSGSGWKEYRDGGSVCGVRLPAGLRESDRLPEPIFTPATKAAEGHDENISFDRAAEIVGGPTAESLRDLTLRLYREAAAYALERGIIIADTKFEFGRDADRPDRLDRRGAHAGLLALLARRQLRARARPAVLRQAVRAGLARGQRLEQAAAGAGAAARGRRGDPRPLPRGLPPAHRPPDRGRDLTLTIFSRRDHP